MKHPDGMIGLTATDADTDLPAVSSDAAEDFVITENVESELYEATVDGKARCRPALQQNRRPGAPPRNLGVPGVPWKGSRCAAPRGRPGQSPQGQHDRDGLMSLRRRVHPRSSGVCRHRRRAIPRQPPRTPPLSIMSTRGELAWQPSN